MLDWYYQVGGGGSFQSLECVVGPATMQHPEASVVLILVESSNFPGDLHFVNAA